MENPLSTGQEAAKGVNLKFIIQVLIAIVILVIVAGTIYWYNFLRGISWKNVKALISQDAQKYENPSNVEKILLQGVRDIVTDFGLLSQARTYAKQSGLSLDRVLVNNALALAKEFEYIKQAA